MKTQIVSKKHADFCNIVNVNRKALIEAGFHESTVSLWARGKRIPTEDSAKKIALTVELELDKIPYRVIT